MNRHIALLPIALAIGFLQPVQAADPAPISTEVYKLAKDDLDHHYDREKKACDTLSRQRQGHLPGRSQGRREGGPGSPEGPAHRQAG